MWGCSSPWQCSVSHCKVTETKAFVEFMIKTERVSLHTSMHAHTNTVYEYTVHSLSLSPSFPPSNSTLVNHSPSLKINAALQPKIAFCILYSSLVSILFSLFVLLLLQAVLSNWASHSNFYTHAGDPCDEALFLQPLNSLTCVKSPWRYIIWSFISTKCILMQLNSVLSLGLTGASERDLALLGTVIDDELKNLIHNASKCSPQQAHPTPFPWYCLAVGCCKICSIGEPNQAARFMKI